MKDSVFCFEYFEDLKHLRGADVFRLRAHPRRVMKSMQEIVIGRSYDSLAIFTESVFVDSEDNIALLYSLGVTP